MGGIRLTGMTWDHRRAIDPLQRTHGMFAEMHPGIEIAWSSQPLHGFEFTPVDQLARSFDFMIFDHPFCGVIAKTGCFLPLDEVLAGATRRAFVGPSLETYVYEGKTWAVPMDAACQVAVSRPDLMARIGSGAPESWGALLNLGQRAARRGLRLAIGLRGVHSLMTFFTLCAALGKPCADRPGEPLFDLATGRAALEHLRELLTLCPAEVLDWNSIELHEAMSSHDDLAFCPAVYCYATYAEADRARPLRFHDFPGPAGARGSTIGGTGLGISAYCAHPQAALAYARFAAAAETQRAFARHHGQPARVETWEDGEIDARYGGCFAATRQTMEQSWIRPRFPGYLKFQAAAGTLIEQHLRGQLAEDRLLGELLTGYERAGSGG